MSTLKKFYFEKKIYLLLFFLIILFISLYLFEVITPFIMAFIIAYITNPLKIFLDKYIYKTLSSFISILVFVFCLLSIFVLILPIIIHQIQNFILLLPGYLTEVENFLRELNTKYLLIEKIKTVDYSSIFKSFSKSLINSSNIIINNSIQFVNSFFNIILIIIISFYLSLEFNKVKAFIYNIADKSDFRDFPILIKEIDNILSKFLRGQGLVCLVLSTIYSVGLLMVGLKFGFLLGICAGIISFVPYLGSFIGGGLALILGFSEFGISPQLILIFLIFVCGQLFESYFLTPKFIGEAIKLNPIWIIFALMTGAYLYGFVGVLISIPFAAVLGVIVRHYFFKVFE